MMHYHVKTYDTKGTSSEYVGKKNGMDWYRRFNVLPETFTSFAWALARACTLTAQYQVPVGAYKPMKCEGNHDEAQ